MGPIGNLYREFVSIAYGFFSPLEGFMPWNEVESVLKEGRLLSGRLFPSSDAERAPCGHGVFMERALFVAGAGGCGRRDWRREAWDFVDEAFLEGREALGLGGYFAGVSFVLWGMRHGIPLGGCSYGRYASHVWAWPRGFLDPYAVHVPWTRGLLTRSGLRAVLLGGLPIVSSAAGEGPRVEGFFSAGEGPRPPSVAMRPGGEVAARLWAFC